MQPASKKRCDFEGDLQNPDVKRGLDKKQNAVDEVPSINFYKILNLTVRLKKVPQTELSNFTQRNIFKV